MKYLLLVLVLMILVSLPSAFMYFVVSYVPLLFVTNMVIATPVCFLLAYVIKKNNYEIQ
jgi:drug/metabolite transporter (DMT)-like permease